ncbi:MarR family winged helix-turn-helix transcriptional regulator [Halohasta litorea]|uniref:FaeA/PapI family transcriptional regulator n=1 Tax=Halohasta litorea TaxID=869891 RepID=A0ABD6DEK5_9EURY|nr:MarR family winged helix-turn-helix transcriptional regulator [Halohasta litorea]
MTGDIDLSKYPDDTDKVIVAIDKKTVQSYEYGFTTLKKIAEITGLTKMQARYRVEQLDENGHVRREKAFDRERALVRIWLTPEAEKYARKLLDYEEIVGRFPDDPTQDDFIEVLDHVRELESRIDEMESEIEEIKEIMRF